MLKLKKGDKVRIKKRSILEGYKIKELTGSIFVLYEDDELKSYYLVRDNHKRNSHHLLESEVSLIKEDE